MDMHSKFLAIYLFVKADMMKIKFNFVPLVDMDFTSFKIQIDYGYIQRLCIFKI
jgi:hypothetical protein